MHTFFQLIQYEFHKTKSIHHLSGSSRDNTQFFSDVYRNEGGIDPISFTFFSYMVAKPYSVRSKFQFLQDVLANPFFSEEQKEKVLGHFCSIQAMYYFLTKCVHRRKMKVCPIQVHTDIYMNPLIETDKHTFVLLQNGHKFLFSITDLINITNTALSNTSYFFANPLSCKNPYNNIPFQKSTLYNIYFFIKQCHFQIPLLFHQYFLSNFHLTKFKNENETLIREHAIDRFIEKSSHDELCIEIKKMIVSNKYSKKWEIDPEFPKDRLIQIMRPYLKIHLLFICCTDLLRRDYYDALFRRKMMRFYFYNKRFGRKTYKKKVDVSHGFVFPSKYVYTTVFNDDGLNFHDSAAELREFRTSHMSTSKLIEEQENRAPSDASDDDDDNDEMIE
jgi:hypothetical protein